MMKREIVIAAVVLAACAARADKLTQCWALSAPASSTPSYNAALVGYYKLDNSWKDEITGNYATNNGTPTFSTNKAVGTHCAYYNGSTWTYVSGSPATNWLAGSTNLVLACWLKVIVSWNGYQGVVYSQGDGFNQWNGLFANGQSTVVQLRMYANRVGLDTPTVSPAVGTWFHFIGSWSKSGVMKIYRNGVEVASRSDGSTAALDFGTQFRIAWDPSAGANNIYVDDVQIWKNRPFSSNECYNLYMGTMP